MRDPLCSESYLLELSSPELSATPVSSKKPGLPQSISGNSGG